MQDSQVEVYLWTEHVHIPLWYLPSSLMVEKTQTNLEIRPKLGNKHISATNGMYKKYLLLENGKKVTVKIPTSLTDIWQLLNPQSNSAGGLNGSKFGSH